MPQPKTLAVLVHGLAAALLLLASAAWAQAGSGGADAAKKVDDDLKPGEVHALHGYVLSMDKLQRYALATNALKRAIHDDLVLSDEVKQLAGEPEDTLSDLRARLDHHPTVLAFFTKQGLSADDVVLLPITLMGAAMAVPIKDPDRYPPSINPLQVQFVATHKQEIDNLHLVSDQDDWAN
jgi:hypothetical protein